MTQHPITPPPELVQQWASESLATQSLCNRAAQWGADQELEACLRLVEIDGGEDAYDFARYIRAARRPKPPSLKEQALAALRRYEAEEWCEEMTFDSSIIRRALEVLPE